jgi:hypothetical protein
VCGQFQARIAGGIAAERVDARLEMPEFADQPRQTGRGDDLGEIAGWRV